MPDVTEERYCGKNVLLRNVRLSRSHGRYDECIAFTKCTFKDRNIDSIEADEARGIISTDNKFERP
jgi:hypothetical protein